MCDDARAPLFLTMLTQAVSQQFSPQETGCRVHTDTFPSLFQLVSWEMRGTMYRCSADPLMKWVGFLARRGLFILSVVIRWSPSEPFRPSICK